MTARPDQLILPFDSEEQIYFIDIMYTYTYTYIHKPIYTHKYLYTFLST